MLSEQNQQQHQQQEGSQNYPKQQEMLVYLMPAPQTTSSQKQKESEEFSPQTANVFSNLTNTQQQQQHHNNNGIQANSFIYKIIVKDGSGKNGTSPTENEFIIQSDKLCENSNGLDVVSILNQIQQQQQQLLQNQSYLQQQQLFQTPQQLPQQQQQPVRASPKKTQQPKQSKEYLQQMQQMQQMQETRFSPVLQKPTPQQRSSQKKNKAQKERRTPTPNEKAAGERTGIHSNNKARQHQDRENELPLQISSSKKEILESRVDETLTTDKEEEMLRNQSEIQKCGEYGMVHLEVDHNESKQDSSQIHLKYAKMLEELEQQSMDMSNNFQTETSPSKKLLLGVGGVECLYSEESTCRHPKPTDAGAGTTFAQPQQIQKLQKKRSMSSGCSRIQHLKNKKSSQFEQKQFYEYELYQLKTELQQYMKEEEKLLSILESSNQELSHCDSIRKSPEKGYKDQNSVQSYHPQQNSATQQQHQQQLQFMSFKTSPRFAGERSHDRSRGNESMGVQFLQVSQKKVACSEKYGDNSPTQQQKEHLEGTFSEMETSGQGAHDQKGGQELMAKIIEEEKFVTHATQMTHEEILANLEEATQHLKDENSSQDRDSTQLIKPVKIPSPIGKIKLRTGNSKNTIAYPSAQSNNLIKEDYINNDYKNKTPKIRKVAGGPRSITPSKGIFPAVSADRTEKKSTALSISHSYAQINKKEQSKHQKHNASPKKNLIEMQDIQHSDAINQYSSAEMQAEGAPPTQTEAQPYPQRSSKGSTGTVNGKKESAKAVAAQSKSKRRSAARNDQGKSPSQFSIYHLFNTISNTASPMKHLIRSESRYSKQSCAAAKTQTQETCLTTVTAAADEQCTAESHQEVEDYLHREQKLIDLEKLSKRQSLVQNLKQQEEPEEEELVVNASQKYGNKSPQFKDNKKRDTNTEKEGKLQDLLSRGNYFGFYSKEKSDELKNQRTESIKKAEDLLSSFIQARPSRPDFLNKPLQKAVFSAVQSDKNWNSKQTVSDKEGEDLTTDAAEGYFPQRHSLSERGGSSPRKEEEEQFEEVQEINNSEELLEMEEERLAAERDADEYKTYIVEAGSYIVEEVSLSQRSRRGDGVDISTLLREESKLARQCFNQFNEISFQQLTNGGGGGELSQMSFLKQSMKASAYHSRSSSKTQQQHQNFLNIEIPVVLSPTQGMVQAVANQEQQSPDMHPQFLSSFQAYQNRVVAQPDTYPQSEVKDYEDSQKEQRKSKERPLVQSQSRQELSSTLSSSQMSNRRKSQQTYSKCGLQAAATTVATAINTSLNSNANKKSIQRKRRLEQVSPFSLQSHIKKLEEQQNNQENQSHEPQVLLSSGIKNGNVEMHPQINHNNISDAIEAFNLQQPQQYFNNTYIDAELLYQKRSKSVIKRRDDLMKKKEAEQRIKLEAKNQKIDQLRQTRNQRLVTQQQRSFNQQQSKSSRYQSKGRVCDTSLYVITKQQQHHLSSQEQECDELMQSKEIKNFYDSKMQLNPEDSCGLSGLSYINQTPTAENPSMGKLSMCPQHIQGKLTSNSISAQQLPPASSSFIQQSTNCKSSLLMSESSSFRHLPHNHHLHQQQQQQNTSQNYLQASPGQIQSDCPSLQPSKSNHPNLTSNAKPYLQRTPITSSQACKKQNQHLLNQTSLKQSIVNRTVRLSSKNKTDLNSTIKKIQGNSEVTPYAETKNKNLESSQSYSGKLNYVETTPQGSKYNQHSQKAVNSHQKQSRVPHPYQPQSSQKQLNSSRSVQKLNESYYHYNSKKTTNVANSNNTSMVVGEPIQSAITASSSWQKSCHNCLRLINKGLSTDFCLQHFNAKPELAGK